MTIPIWVAELACAFWKTVGEREPFPRNLHRPITHAGLLNVVWLVDLHFESVLKRLRKVGVVCEMNGNDRPLHACLVARDGEGIVFVNYSDAADQQRFSLAHEIAHFLRDYWQPRMQVERRIGKAALQVLDGRRAATVDERLHAVLHSTPLGFHVHLLARQDDGEAAGAVADAEWCADRLAFELLAPLEHLMTVHCRTGSISVEEWEVLLRQVYGLPQRQARQYAEILAPRRRVDPLLAGLGYRV